MTKEEFIKLLKEDLGVYEGMITHAISNGDDDTALQVAPVINYINYLMDKVEKGVSK